LGPLFFFLLFVLRLLNFAESPPAAGAKEDNFIQNLPAAGFE